MDIAIFLKSLKTSQSMNGLVNLKIEYSLKYRFLANDKVKGIIVQSSYVLSHRYVWKVASKGSIER